MLSRRIFRQLTDSVLRDPGAVAQQQPACRAALRASGCTSGCPRARQSSSSTRWKTRQGNDFFAREARVQGLKSRAAFKLLELNEKHKLFKPGQTVVDLGFAPGSWSQVAATRTAPGGRVVGIDVIPAQPPRGVSTIQGNFLSAHVQDDVRAYVRDPALGRLRKQSVAEEEEGFTEEQVDEMERGYIDIERRAHMEGVEMGVETNGDKTTGDKTTGDKTNGIDTQRPAADVSSGSPYAKLPVAERDRRHGRVVDVVLSDMSEPWDQVAGFYKKSLSDPYSRMMNTSGNPFRDHAGSMDLCTAALTFAFDTLKTGGHFLCKFYQGAEEKEFETKLKRLFGKVAREKPESSRAASKEAYFVALRRKEAPTREEVFRE